MPVDDGGTPGWLAAVAARPAVVFADPGPRVRGAAARGPYIEADPTPVPGLREFAPMIRWMVRHPGRWLPVFTGTYRSGHLLASGIRAGRWGFLLHRSVEVVTRKDGRGELTVFVRMFTHPPLIAPYPGNM